MDIVKMQSSRPWAQNDHSEGHQHLRLHTNLSHRHKIKGRHNSLLSGLGLVHLCKLKLPDLILVFPCTYYLLVLRFEGKEKGEVLSYFKNVPGVVGWITDHSTQLCRNTDTALESKYIWFRSFVFLAVLLKVGKRKIIFILFTQWQNIWSIKTFK